MTHLPLTAKDFDSSFLDEVEAKSGQDIRLCYVCGKCSAGCPLAPDMKHLPHQIMSMVQSGMRQRVLMSPTMWVCAACSTCSTRCPKEIDINAVMDALNEMAMGARISTNSRVKAFREEFINSISKHGRMHEIGLAIKFNMRSGDPLNDADMGLKLFRKGKIKLTAEDVKNKKIWGRLFKKEAK